MQTCKNAGTLQDENLQMLWPALSSSMLKACVDWLCKERENRKQKDSCTGLLLLEQVNYLSPRLGTWHIPSSLLMHQMQISRFLTGSMGCQSAGNQLSAASSFLSSSFFELLSATMSSKRVASAQVWNRNQASEPQVHAVYKPCFSPSRRTCSNTIYK